MKENLLQLIWHHLFGYVYYTVIYNVKGTFELGIGGKMYNTKMEAMQSLQDNRTYSVFEIVAVRSRNKYVIGTTPQGYSCNYLAEKTAPESTDKAEVSN